MERIKQLLHPLNLLLVDSFTHSSILFHASRSADDYFVSRKLYPNIDFYSGLVYKAIGCPTDYFPVLFTMGRMAGWLAHVRLSSWLVLSCLIRTCVYMCVYRDG